MRVCICVGERTTTPYRFADLGINVYSIEELCVCIQENAYLLDDSLVNDRLVEWIDHECELHDLARVLNSMIYKKDALVRVCTMILDYTGLFEERTVLDIESVLRQGAGMSNIERRKGQIDYLVQKKKLSPAIKSYDRLLNLWKEQEQKGEPLPPVTCLAAIWHNKGVAFAGLITYDKAADCFLKAYQIENREDFYRDYLAAKRMELSEEQYVSFVADNMEWYDATLELEHEMDQVLSEWEQRPEYLRLYHRKETRGEGDPADFYRENQEITWLLKNSYRGCVLD